MDLWQFMVTFGQQDGLKWLVHNQKNLDEEVSNKGQTMTGKFIGKSGNRPIVLALIGGLVLMGCDEEGNFAFPAGGAESEAAPAFDPSTPLRSETTEEDVERPDIFEVTDRGLWDGRPSLGGAWVAHPDVQDPERALIRNTETGATVIGALFRRERENPGPLLQVSSDVAEELGILPGAPTELYVVALRRQEVTIEAEAVENNPVLASLDSPVNVETTTLDPVVDDATIETSDIADEATDAVGTAADVADTAADTVDAAADSAEAAANTGVAAIAAAAIAAVSGNDDDSAEPEIAVSDLPPTDAAAAALPAGIATAGPADLTGTRFQIGVFSREANAIRATQTLQGAGIPTSILTGEAGGRDVWRVVSSPSAIDDGPEATLARIKDAGFSDAILISAPATE